MKINESKADRIARTAVAGAAVLVARKTEGAASAAAWAVAAVVATTAAVGFCPLYRVFGIDTAGGK